MHTLFEGIFTTSTITVTNFLLCLFVSLAIGMFLALIYDRKLCSRSFLIRSVIFIISMVLIYSFLTFVDLLLIIFRFFLNFYRIYSIKAVIIYPLGVSTVQAYTA